VVIITLDLAQLRNQVKNAESQWNMKYLTFDKRLREIEQELSLPSYARLSDVMQWCEKLIVYEQKIELMREATMTLASEAWKKLEQNIYDYQSKDDRTITIMSEFVSFLVSLDKRYSQRLDVFLNFLDKCVRYLRGYTEDLEKNGLSLNVTLHKARQLGTMHWINGKSYHMKLKG
jgi:DNA repair exonuclease SbcCD ATPase subunit